MILAKSTTGVCMLTQADLELRCDKEEDQWIVWHLLHWGMCILVHEALALPSAFLA